METVKEMELLFEYLEQLGCIGEGKDFISFDFSLARGLDYYTGLIYEGVLLEGGVGSIAGGGRYDELIGMFSQKSIPSIGVSIGIERIFAILEKRAQNIRAAKTQVIVASIGKNMTKHRFALLNQLWQAGIPAEMSQVDNPKPQKQIDLAFEQGSPLIIWIGEDELTKGIVKVKVLNTKEEIEVERNEHLIPLIKDLLLKEPILKAIN